MPYVEQPSSPLAPRILVPALIGVLLLAACDSQPSEPGSGGTAGPLQGGADSQDGSQPSRFVPPTSRPSCKAAISWVDAERYVDKRVALIGTVVQVTIEPNEDVQLILGVGPDDPVFVYLPASAVRRLPAPPRQVYEENTVCVVGVIEKLGDQLQIRVSDADDITVG